MNAKTTKQDSTTITKATSYAKQLHKEGYGSCTIVRAVTQKYPSLARRDVLRIAASLDINLGTASRQFQEVRSGLTVVTGL